MTLRDLTNATLGFEALAAAIDCPSKSVHRMLSARGNPSTQNLCAIFTALCQHLGVTLESAAKRTQPCHQGTSA